MTETSKRSGYLPETDTEAYYGAIFRVHREMHARVSEPVAVPARIRHSAYLLPEGAERPLDRVRQRFEEIVRLLQIAPEHIQWGERSGRVIKPLANGATLCIQWEIHTEFYSYTTIHQGTATPADGADDLLPEPVTFPALPPLGTKLVDVDILAVPGLELAPLLRTYLLGGPIYGGAVLGGSARVWTTFQVDENGQGRYVVGAGSLSPGRLGRVIRRLVEIENYYHLILMPLDSYRREVVRLRAIERRLAEHSAEIATTLARGKAPPDWEQQRLVALTQDFAELVHLTEHMRYELSATNSYFAIFQERLRWLREVTGEGFQTLEEFLAARVGPAIRSYRNFIERADVLTIQSTALGNMVRTRVSLSMEEQSLATMQAMNRRVELQVILQRTVEGLSFIVLSYYLTGLAGYVFKALEALVRLPIQPEVLTFATIPVWMIGVWFFTRRIKRVVHSVLGGHGEETAKS
jgi:uncharacterized membrane-anchored protein